MLSLSNLQRPLKSSVILNNHSGNLEGDYSWRPQNQFKTSQEKRFDIAQQYLGGNITQLKVATVNGINQMSVSQYVKEFKASIGIN